MNVGKRIVLLVAVVALVAAACSSADSGGGDSLSGADAELADAITQAMMEDADPTSPFGEEEAACFGTSIVSEMGSARLIELGLDIDAVESGTSPSDVDLTEADIDAMVKVMTTCVDFREVVVQEFDGIGISDEGIACIKDGMSDDLMSEMARAAFDDEAADNSAATDEMFGVIMGCLSTEDLQKLGSS